MKIREVDVEETRKDVPFVVGGIYRWNGDDENNRLGECSSEFRMIIKVDWGYAFLDPASGVAFEIIDVDGVAECLYHWTLVPDAELVVPRKERG